MFAPFFDEKRRLCGILFNSDRDRNRILHFLKLSDIIDILTAVGTCDPDSGEFRYDADRGEYVISNRMMTEDEIERLRLQHERMIETLDT